MEARSIHDSFRLGGLQLLVAGELPQMDVDNCQKERRKAHLKIRREDRFFSYSSDEMYQIHTKLQNCQDTRQSKAMTLFLLSEPNCVLRSTVANCHCNAVISI